MRLHIFSLGLILGLVVWASAQGASPAALICGAAGDANGDGRCNIADPVYLLSYLFKEGPSPCASPEYQRLPATGQTLCYNSDGEVINCTSSNFPGQDAYYQAGRPLIDRFIDNGDKTVTDQTTGLMWQKQANAGGRMTWASAKQYCEDLILGGYDDWRMPTVLELQGLVNYSLGNPSVDPVFTDVEDSWYFTSTESVKDEELVRAVLLRSSNQAAPEEPGDVESVDRGHIHPVWAVRDCRFIDNGDGTVTDTKTGLMWQKNANGSGQINWQAALRYCEDLILGGYDDWRMPNIRELQSLIDYSSFKPEINPGFQNIRDSWYFSSTSSVKDPRMARAVLFITSAPMAPEEPGDIESVAKTHQHPVWAVRNVK